MDNQDPQQDNKPGFKPARNPFMSAIGLGAKKESGEAPAVPQNKEVIVGDKETTLMGSTAEQKAGKLNIPEPENKVPEETLYQWQAPEFSYTQKPLGWYFMVFALFTGMGVLAYFFVNSNIQRIITFILLLVMAIALTVWANRKPKTLSYSVTNYGVVINNKRFSFNDFRAFYEYLDYNQPSLELIPAKRFGTLISMPLATPEADEILDTIAQMVPEIEHKEDVLDKIIRGLRF